MLKFLDQPEYRRILPNLTQGLTAHLVDPDQLHSRIRILERDISIPVRVFVLLAIFFHFEGLFSASEIMVGDELMNTVRNILIFLLVFNVAGGVILSAIRRLTLDWVLWVIFPIQLMDALFFGTMIFVDSGGGFDGWFYWGFLAVIIRNSVILPVPSFLIVMNSTVILVYFLAGLSDIRIVQTNPQSTGILGTSGDIESFILRLVLLTTMMMCCYGIHVILHKQRRAEEEAEEFERRQSQLQATGRLAGEIAHQLKNPLAIINNAAFTIQKLSEKNDGLNLTEPVRIIREEVDKSDRIITELMGYAQLVEGRVERIDVNVAVKQDVASVFPKGTDYKIQARMDLAFGLPTLMMQKSHFSEILINILQNAREALDGEGSILISTSYCQNYSVDITVQDNGPGIAAKDQEKIFEPYFTKKTKGTGLGLAIVKHNAEIYGGSVRIESKSGSGATFIINLPAKSSMKIRR